MTLAGGNGSRGPRRAGRNFGLTGFHYEGVVALAGLTVVWQIVSLFVPHFLFPSVPEIAERLLAIFTSWKSIFDALATSLRILAGLAGAFVLGIVLALPMARSAMFERYASPLLNFNQGIPALSWVVIAIIWFRGIEFRIFFIMVMTTLPSFTLQILDAYHTMSKDLFEMTLSFRPTCCLAFSRPGRSISATRRVLSSSPSWSVPPAASVMSCSSSSSFSTWPVPWLGRLCSSSLCSSSRASSRCSRHARCAIAPLPSTPRERARRHCRLCPGNPDNKGAVRRKSGCAGQARA
jgi:hypothetical protein